MSTSNTRTAADVVRDVHRAQAALMRTLNLRETKLLKARLANLGQELKARSGGVTSPRSKEP